MIHTTTGGEDIVLPSRHILRHCILKYMWVDIRQVRIHYNDVSSKPKFYPALHAGYSSTQLTSPGWVAPTYPPQYAPSDIPPRPMSYSNPNTTSSETRRYFVKVPEGVSRGQIFTVLLDGFEHTVHCPNESNSGDTIIVTASPNAVHARYEIFCDY